MTVNESKDNFFSTNLSLNCGGKILDLSIPRIMGIINVTPDSFYDGGKYIEPQIAVDKAGELLEQGADILDIGAESSRPGANRVDPGEEEQRLIPVIEQVRKSYPDAIISLDTTRSSLAYRMIDKYQVNIVNDISGFEDDAEMIDIISKMQVPYIVMHMKGTPNNMQLSPQYHNVLDEIIAFFSEKINILKKKGVNDIIIDPGFGFGKSLDHNYQLLANIHDFQLFELPILAGVSRKSMVSKLLNSSAKNSLNGTTALHMILLSKGVNILRVHDVNEAREAIKIFLETKKYQW